MAKQIIKNTKCLDYKIKKLQKCLTDLKTQIVKLSNCLTAAKFM